jgi:hypothetical protein
VHYQYWPLSPAVPAGTTEAAPQVTPWLIVQGHLKQVRVKVPAGHAGLTGYRIVYQDQQIAPWSNYFWWTTDNDTDTWQWGDEIMATGLAFQAFNTDTVPHVFWCLAEIWPTVEPAPAGYNDYAPLSDVQPATLYAVGGLERTGAA